MPAYFAVIEKAIRSGEDGEALKSVKAARKLFAQEVARLKEVAIELRPPELDILGACHAMRQHFSRLKERTGIRIHFTETLGRRRLAGNVSTVLFRIVQEALTNAIRHGRAKKADVSLRASKEAVRLTIRDNGMGFDASEQRARKTPQMGFHIMREMAASAGGVFEVASAPGTGTIVRVRLPLETAASGPGDVTGREKTAARGRTTRPSGRGVRPQKRSRT
jgi:signal transduction histidine kinase